MAAPSAARGVLTERPEWLLAPATGALIAFHYLARADELGVHGHDAYWFALTHAPLSPTLHFVASGVLLGVLPVLIARFLWGMSLGALGLGVGRWRVGLAWLAVGIPLAVVAGAVGAGGTAVRAVYPLDPELTADAGRFLPHALRQVLYFGAWEVLFRGVLLFGLRGRLGDGAANLVQTALSVVAHFGRPLPETIAALPAGLLFGAIDLRIGSVWYIAAVHWLVGMSLDWWILYGSA